eukprot:TRINITY_DN16241_c0_g1_i1.p1 TRINITY_DN16241_c0_g1~~TRINITY_DN16241_c0_g1_i1.p1  ORF type:complete len:614 (+),score=205.76 TRINITY_DN16241_c0_g1_i1:85-1926(+)
MAAATASGSKGGGKDLPSDEEAEEDADPSDFQVRHLGDEEDLVIDGETAVDDLLVAQRIAEQEDLIAKHVLVDEDAEGRARPQKAEPTQEDLDKLMRLLRETSKLTSKIGELPSQFESVISQEVKDACRAAAEAVKSLPIPKDGAKAETTPQEPVGQEKWAKPKTLTDKEAREAALAAVDLESTDEEEEADQKGNTAGAEGEATKKEKIEKTEQIDEDAAADDDEAEDEDKAKPDGKEKAKPEKEEKEDEGAPVIQMASLPERVAATDDREEIGKITSIVDGLVVIEGLPDSKALDLQSVVCLEDGLIIGVVVDVFGAVTEPFYLVYVSGKAEESVKVGLKAFAATSLQETSFLCDSADVAAIRKRLADMEGSDDDSDLVDGEDSDEEGEGWGAAGAALLEAARRGTGIWAEDGEAKSDVKREWEDSTWQSSDGWKTKEESYGSGGRGNTWRNGSDYSDDRNGSSSAWSRDNDWSEYSDWKDGGKGHKQGGYDSSDWGHSSSSRDAGYDSGPGYRHGASESSRGSQPSRLPPPPAPPLPQPPKPPPAPSSAPSADARHSERGHQRRERPQFPPRGEEPASKRRREGGPSSTAPPRPPPPPPPGPGGDRSRGSW